MTPDRFHTVVRWARVALLIQLAVSTVVVRTLAQRRPLEETVAVQAQAFSDRAAAVEARVRALEDLKIGERLAVLDRVTEDAHEIKMLSYGTVFALIGTLVIGVIERRSRRKTD